MESHAAILVSANAGVDAARPEDGSKSVFFGQNDHGLRWPGNAAISSSSWPSSLRLAAQDVALSRRKQGFESPRERQINQLVSPFALLQVSRSRRQKKPKVTPTVAQAENDTLSMTGAQAAALILSRQRALF